MNIAFHTLASIATAAALSALGQGDEQGQLPRKAKLIPLGAGILIGISVHGVLDALPHAYPIRSVFDIATSLLLFGVALLLTRKRHRLLVAACFLGSILPDLLDLGPAIINKRMGTLLPVFKLFPWHWKAYSGSIYDGSRQLESTIDHLGVLVISLSVLLRFRRSLLG